MTTPPRELPKIDTARIRANLERATLGLDAYARAVEEIAARELNDGAWAEADAVRRVIADARAMCDAIDGCGLCRSVWEHRAADSLAAAVDRAVATGQLNARHAIADARLDYGDPIPTTTDERVNVVQLLHDAAREILNYRSDGSRLNFDAADLALLETIAGDVTALAEHVAAQRERATGDPLTTAVDDLRKIVAAMVPGRVWVRLELSPSFGWRAEVVAYADRRASVEDQRSPLAAVLVLTNYVQSGECRQSWGLAG